MQYEVEQNCPMSDIDREYQYAHSWKLITAGVVFGVLAIGLAVNFLLNFADTFDFGLLTLLGGSAILMSLRMAVDRLRCSRRIALTTTAILVPRSPFSSDEMPVSYGSIRKLSSSHFLGCEVLTVKHTGGRFSITDLQLVNAQDFDEIQRLLSQKTSLPCVPTIQWPKQFSLRSIFVVITLAAVLLGVRLFIHPTVYWFELGLLLAYLATAATTVWLVISAPQWARVFAAGFLLGGIWEVGVVSHYVKHEMARLLPATLAPEGWYPFFVPFSRMLILWTNESWVLQPWLPMAALLMGCAASGIVCGIVALVAWYGTRLLRRSRTRH